MLGPISEIHISRLGLKDKLIWEPIVNETFSIKSAYHLEIIIRRRFSGETSERNDKYGVWKKIWELQAPNGTRTMLWRAVRGALPTKHNLSKRGITSNDLCLVCALKTETACHVLWSCEALVKCLG